jgi:histidinol-phosphate aminotransferase
MPFDPSKLAAPAVRTLAPYVPGKPLEELEREYGVRDAVKLASNENPLGPGPRALEAIAAAARELGLYPDGNGYSLRQALAARHGYPMEWITLGNGSNDILVLIAEAFLTPESEAIVSEYAFAIYGLAIHATGATTRVASAFPWEHRMPLGHDLDAMAKLVNERTRLIYVANPNNPTGTWVEAQALRKFISNVPEHTLVLVDEAYFEYVEQPGYASAVDWLPEHPNLVVTRTFSKAFGLAGLRVGYAVSHPAVADYLNRVRQPFNVNSIALEAAKAALQDQEHIQRSVALVRDGMQQVRAGLERLNLRYVPSAGNFLLVDCARPAGVVYEEMLRRGVIVRPMGGYSLPTCLRITIGTQDQNERMLEALAGSLSA